MNISISADSTLGIATQIADWVRERGHQVRLHGALDASANAQWAWASAAAATDVAEGRADQAIVCCFTGTGATMAASRIAGTRAALCTDAFTARGARQYNDANVLGISLRLTSETVMKEMLDAWFSTQPEAAQALNIAYVNRLDRLDRPDRR
ncbi:MAG: lacB [Rhizobacter sp.]|nr:lacB [Rhizobacter sp.]